MIYLASYVEELRPGWCDFEKKIWENFILQFGVCKHYYVVRTEKDNDWFWNNWKVGHDAGVVGNLQQLKDYSLKAHDNIKFVNVQPPSFWDEMRLEHTFLPEFVHPDDACYIFGPNHGQIEMLPGYNVSITLNESTLYASSAAAIVLYDRRAKIETGSRTRSAT